jgi:xanthine dehydrogenase molybdopterin binding subunit/xanthine dehydrogenase small subunit
MTATRTETVSFVLDGASVTVTGEPARRTLLDWLRKTGRTGTKEGCAEGDCGACTVALVERRVDGSPTYRAINACLALLPMLEGREVVTVEGLVDERGPREGLHPVQRALVEKMGSQCGYCTPGFAVSMFEAYYRDDVREPWQLADQLQGNLCRCTGYRPIREALSDAVRERDERRARGERDRFHLRLLESPSARAPLPELAFEAGGERFDRPTTLAELLALRAAHPEATLVAGATELAVEINKKAKRFAHLISTEGVAELRVSSASPDELSLGGATTLTELEELLGDDLPMLRKMLHVFASRQIRHRATVAGNLVTASPIGDLAPVLLALSSWIELSSVRGTRRLALDELFLGYRKTALAPDEVVTRIGVPRRPAAGLRRICDSYKVSKRRELDISIVAAAFVVDVDDANVVRHARLAYGGVAATPARATEAEALLVGRRFERAKLEPVLAALERAFTPLSDVRAGADYRRGLVRSLFEKLVAGVRSEAQDEPLAYTISEPWPGADQSRALAHESAHLHVSGHALYVDDEAERRGAMLELWPVTSPHAHARVVRRSAERARAVPGVVRVLFAEDVPGMNDVGALRHDEPLFASDAVSFHGQLVAVVVATSYEVARAAAALVEVDYEPLPALLTLDDAVREGSFHTSPHVIARGDVDDALARSPRTLEGTFVLGGQEHFYLETHAAFAERGEDDELVVRSSTQHPTEIQTVVAHVLELPKNKVIVESPRMGGGFGGKETQGNAWAALVALAAWHTRRPCRVQLDRDLDMTMTGKRHPFSARFRVGFDDAGSLLALSCSLVADGGFALDLSESICDRALFHLDNAYYVPAVRFEGRVAKTHLVSNTAFRGFGGPQGMLVMEEIVDRVARELGLAPELVRRRNLYRGTGETNTTHYGQHLDDCRAPRVFDEVLSRARFVERRREVEAFNAANEHVKRGLAVTPVKFGISFTASFLNQAGALVLVYRDGTAQVNHAGTEMGQGLYTKIQGVVMRELGLRAESVRVMKTSTDKIPNTSPTAASAGADLNGAAVRDACLTLRERLAPLAARLASERAGATFAPTSMVFAGGQVFPVQRPELTLPFGAVVERAYLEQLPLTATGFYRTPGIGYDRATGRGKPFYYFAYGAAVTEVEVDGLSGMKRVRAVDIVHDVGDSLHPSIDRGQIEGGFVQGMGWLTGEELSFSPQGRLLTHSASTYQIPAISDAPPELRVTLLERAPQPGTIHGSKAVGEPPLMLALSVREALRDAVAAFGPPGGQVELASPATHEAIYRAVRARLERGSRPSP